MKNKQIDNVDLCLPIYLLFSLCLQTALATVYTQLRSMAERSEVDVIRSEGGEALYRRCGAGEHHHHLRCRSCGHVEELHAPTVEDWANEVARSSGYTDLAHTLEVTGLCPRCAYA